MGDVEIADSFNLVEWTLYKHTWAFYICSYYEFLTSLLMKQFMNLYISILWSCKIYLTVDFFRTIFYSILLLSTNKFLCYLNFHLFPILLLQWVGPLCSLLCELEGEIFEYFIIMLSKDFMIKILPRLC